MICSRYSIGSLGSSIERRTNYALIGGLGAALRGTVRTTWDIDLLVAVSQMELAPLLEAIQQEAFDLDIYQAIRSWNEDHLLEFHRGLVRVDWIKALLPLFQRILERAKWEDIGGRPIRVADAEGLLVLKLIAMSRRTSKTFRAFSRRTMVRWIWIGSAANGGRWSMKTTQPGCNSSDSSESSTMLERGHYRCLSIAQ